MPFTVKDWRNLPTTTTPISAEALEDMETRLSGYTDGRLQDVDTGAGHGPLVFKVGGATFSGTYDPVLYVGYNYASTGNPIQAGEPRVGFVTEADYNDGTKRTLEAYVEHHNADGTLSARPFFSQVKRDATTAATFQTSTALQGNIISFLGESTAPVSAVQRFAFEQNRLTLFGEAGAPLGDPYIRIKSVSGGGSSLRLGHGTTDDSLIIQTEGTTFASLTSGTRRNLTLYNTPNGSNGSAISVGDVIDNAAVGTFAVANSHVGVKGLVVRGKASQSGNLLEIQDSASAVLSSFTENGYFTTRKTAAPADAELASGELALWFDATNGAAKLMVKAKETGGTVRTATVALA